jgi:hypothetical protein
MVYPKLKHLQLAQQLQRHFSCVLIPSKSFACILSNSFLVNTVFNAPSAINSSILSEYFDNPLAEAPLASYICAKKSTSSLKASLMFCGSVR